MSVYINNYLSFLYSKITTVNKKKIDKNTTTIYKTLFWLKFYVKSLEYRCFVFFLISFWIRLRGPLSPILLDCLNREYVCDLLARCICVYEDRLVLLVANYMRKWYKSRAYFINTLKLLPVLKILLTE